MVNLRFFLLIAGSFCNLPFLGKGIKIGFLVTYLAVTGSEVAIYDYADCNETILGNESVIIVLPIDDPYLASHPQLVREKFSKRFGKKYYECTAFEQMDAIVAHEKIEILYMLRGCGFESIISRICKNAVHAAFFGVPVHGDAYACVSKWMSQQYKNVSIPYVPHMVRLPDVIDDLRDELSIPNNAIIFGRHGGIYGFDIEFVKEAIVQVARENKHIYFLFMNTEKFCDLPNVIYLSPTADMVYKTKFINTCDAMIHARLRGETFGLACAEFSIKNKPVITWSGSPERSHINILGNKAIYYSDKQDILAILSNFKKETTKSWDAYSSYYNPNAIMQKFNEVFIQPLIKQRK